MGRLLRRVPLDFDWPQDKVWEGFLMPDDLRLDDCPDCMGTGATPARQWLNKVASYISIIAGDHNDEERGLPMHPYLTSAPWGAPVDRPGTEFTDFARALAPEAVFGARGVHVDHYRVTQALLEAARLSDRWGWCPRCEGSALIEAWPGQQEKAEAWEPTEPPSGEGWQMWEDTSEGSPISPVFDTPEKLALWLANSTRSAFASYRLTYDQWLEFIKQPAGSPLMTQVAPGVTFI